MGFEGWGYYFEGPFSELSDLRPHSGVYVIWCETDGIWNVQAAEAADDVAERVRSHEDKDWWKDHCHGRLYFSASYLTDQVEIAALEQAILSGPAVPRAVKGNPDKTK